MNFFFGFVYKNPVKVVRVGIPEAVNIRDGNQIN